MLCIYHTIVSTNTIVFTNTIALIILVIYQNTVADIGAFRQSLLFSFQPCCSKMYFPMPFLRLSPTGSSLSACRQRYFFSSSHSLIFMIYHYTKGSLHCQDGNLHPIPFFLTISVDLLLTTAFLTLAIYSPF